LSNSFASAHIPSAAISGNHALRIPSNAQPVTNDCGSGSLNKQGLDRARLPC
jgi:hypothetical protein